MRTEKPDRPEVQEPPRTRPRPQALPQSDSERRVGASADGARPRAAKEGRKAATAMSKTDLARPQNLAWEHSHSQDKINLDVGVCALEEGRRHVSKRGYVHPCSTQWCRFTSYDVRDKCSAFVAPAVCASSQISTSDYMYRVLLKVMRYLSSRHGASRQSVAFILHNKWHGSQIWWLPDWSRESRSKKYPPKVSLLTIRTHQELNDRHHEILYSSG